MTTPLVTVLMPVYNAMPFLPEAVNSVRAQSMTNFELIIIDDCSCDGSRDYLASVTDDRISILYNSTNLGPGLTRQKGVDIARGKYLALLDADDIAMPNGLYTQVQFMEQHPEVGLAGAGWYRIDEHGETIEEKRPSNTTDVELRWKCLLGNPFVCSTVIMRRMILVANNIRFGDYRGTEDYDLWTQLLYYTRVAQHDSLVAKYRINSRGLSATNRHEMLSDHVGISCRTISEQIPGFNLSNAEVQQLVSFVHGKWVDGYLEVGASQLRADVLYLRLLKSFCQRYREAIGIESLKEQESLRLARRLLNNRSLSTIGLMADLSLFSASARAFLRKRARRKLLSLL